MEAVHAWPPEAQGHLTMSNASSLTSRVPNVFIVSVLRRHTCPKSLLKFKTSLRVNPYNIKKRVISFQQTVIQNRHYYSKREEWGHRWDQRKIQTSGQTLIPLAPCLMSRAYGVRLGWRLLYSHAPCSPHGFLSHLHSLYTTCLGVSFNWVQFYTWNLWQMGSGPFLKCPQDIFPVV